MKNPESSEGKIKSVRTWNFSFNVATSGTYPNPIGCWTRMTSIDNLDLSKERELPTTFWRRQFFKNLYGILIQYTYWWVGWINWTVGEAEETESWYIEVKIRNTPAGMNNSMKRQIPCPTFDAAFIRTAKETRNTLSVLFIYRTRSKPAQRKLFRPEIYSDWWNLTLWDF